MEMRTQKRRPHYAWLVLLGCCMLQGTGLGIFNNCAPLFYNPICAELGFSMGALTTEKTIYGITCCLTMLFASRLLRRFGCRIILSTAVLVTGITAMLTSTYTQLWQWYLNGAIQGVSLAFMGILTAPLILNNWFKKNVATAMSISAAAAGIFGMIMSQIVEAIISGISWRAAIFINGVICIVGVLPFTLFVLTLHPSEKGMQAYGYDPDAPEPAASGRGKYSPLDALRNPSILLCLGYILCTDFCGAFPQHLKTYGIHVGFVSGAAAMLVTGFLIGNTVIKLFFGWFTDRFGVPHATMFGIALSILGMLPYFTASYPLLLGGSVLLGTTAMLTTTNLALVVRHSVPREQYDDTYSFCAMVSTLIYSVSISVIGFLYDITAGYFTAVLLIVVLFLVCAVFSLVLFRRTARLKSKSLLPAD